MEIVNSVIVLQPGMYILRHPGKGQAPLAITPGPDSKGVVKTLATGDGVLRSGRDCIVMHVMGEPVQLAVLAFLKQAGDQVPQLRLDQVRLEDGAPVAQAAPAPAQPPASGREIEVPAHGITLIGHVEREGDMVAVPGNTLGKPAADLRVEGFQVVWPDKPAGVDLTYAVAIESYGSLPAARVGQYCGTRNQARRITEVTLSLTGAGASALRLTGTAHFSGGYDVPVVSGIALSGPSGLEHLSGLQLSVAPANASDPKGWDASPQTHVFKAAPAVQAAAGKTAAAPAKADKSKAGTGKAPAKAAAKPSSVGKKK